MQLVGVQHRGDVDRRLPDEPHQPWSGGGQATVEIVAQPHDDGDGRLLLGYQGQLLKHRGS